MNLRLAFDLLLRRHGALRISAVALTVCAFLAASASFVQVTDPPKTGREPHDPGALPDARLRNFSAILVPQAALDAQQRQVIECALRHQLTLGRADFGIDLSTGSVLQTATLQLQLQGSYASLQGFLSELLAVHPALAVGALTMQREAGGKHVDARVKLVFYFAGNPVNGT